MPDNRQGSLKTAKPAFRLPDAAKILPNPPSERTKPCNTPPARNAAQP